MKVLKNMFMILMLISLMVSVSQTKEDFNDKAWRLATEEKARNGDADAQNQLMIIKKETEVKALEGDHEASRHLTIMNSMPEYGPTSNINVFAWGYVCGTYWGGKGDGGIKLWLYFYRKDNEDLPKDIENQGKRFAKKHIIPVIEKYISENYDENK